MITSGFPIENNIKQLIKSWYIAAENDINIDTVITKLYEETNNAAISLNLLCMENNSDEKVAKVCIAAIREFSRFNARDTDHLAKWVAKNTKYKSRLGMEPTGAYQPLHLLLFSVAAAAKNCPSISAFDTQNQLSGLAKLEQIDSSALDYIQGQTLTYSKTNLKDLLAIRKSWGREIANKELVRRLNNNEITLQDLGIMKDENLVENILDFFGESCGQIHHLELPSNMKFVDLSFLKYFKNLRTLKIPSCEVITKFKSLSYCPKLQILKLKFCEQITHNDLSRYCKKCTNLKILDLTGCEKIKDSEFLQNFKNLEKLKLRGCSELTNIAHIKHCPNLLFLDVTFCQKIPTLNPLKSCKKLQTLILDVCKQVTPEFLEVLQFLNDLQVLSLLKCKNIDNLSFLQHCINLRYLNLAQNKQFTKINDVKNCKNLKTIDISECPNLVNISVLFDLEKLKSINAKQSDKIPRTDLRALKANKIKVTIE